MLTLLLNWVYTLIAAAIVILIIAELFQERRWKNQMALAILLIPLVLRILHIK
jgi:hypothetical protein